MGIFSDLDANEVFAGGGTAAVGSNPNNISWTDKIFGTVGDFGTEYLKILGRTELDNLAFKNSARAQAAVLNTTEVPQNVGVAPVQSFVPTAAPPSNNSSMIMLGLVALAAYVVLK